MTTQARAIELTKLNIHAIFGERDAPQRLDNIAQIWVASGQALFVEPQGIFKTYEEISAMVEKIQGFGGPDDKFVELSEYAKAAQVTRLTDMYKGEVECLKHDEQDDVWVARLKWGVGAKDAAPRMTGWDVVTIVGGKIKACYTFLNA